jgi:hypothetical protein
MVLACAGLAAVKAFFARPNDAVEERRAFFERIREDLPNLG